MASSKLFLPLNGGWLAGGSVYKRSFCVTWQPYWSLSLLADPDCAAWLCGQVHVQLYSVFAIRYYATHALNDDVVLCVLVRGSKPGKNVQLLDSEIRSLCLKSREIFLNQPVLLELEAPLKICGTYVAVELLVIKLLNGGSGA